MRKLHEGCHAEVTLSWAARQIHPLPTSLTCLNAFKLPVRQTSCCFEKRGAVPRGHGQRSKGITCHGGGPWHSWFRSIRPELLLLLQRRYEANNAGWVVDIACHKGRWDV